MICFLNNICGAEDNPKKPVVIENNYYGGLQQFYPLRTLTAYILLVGSFFCNCFLVNLFHLIHWSQN